jgi:hypothetical protein
MKVTAGVDPIALHFALARDNDIDRGGCGGRLA